MDCLVRIWLYIEKSGYLIVNLFMIIGDYMCLQFFRVFWPVGLDWSAIGGGEQGNKFAMSGEFFLLPARLWSCPPQSTGPATVPFKHSLDSAPTCSLVQVSESTGLNRTSL